MYTIIIALCAVFTIAFTTMEYAYSQQKNSATTRLTAEQQKKINELVNLGLQQQNTDPQAAIQYFSQAIAMNPIEPILYAYLGRVQLVAFKDYVTSRANFTKAIELAPKFAAAYFFRAVGYLDQQLLKEAEADFLLALKLEPKSYPTLRNLAVTQNLLGKYSEAIATVSKAIKIKPKESDLYYVRGNIYQAMRKYKESLQDYKLAIQCDQKNFNAYTNSAALKGMLGDNKGAIEDYTYIINNMPPNKLNYYNRGHIYAIIQNFAKAEADCNEAIKLDPLYVMAHTLRLLSLQKQGKITEAITSADDILKKNPQDAAAFHNAGGAVQERLRQDDFVNKVIFFIRAQSRAALGDKIGACVDMRKAAALGYPQASQELATYCPPSTVFEPSPSFPEHMQFFPREANDSANVQLSGVLLQGGFDSVYAELFRNGEKQYRIAAPIQYYTVLRGTESIQQASISLSCRIRAELAVYSIRFGVKSTATDTVLAERDSLVCGDVYFVSGQSNAVLGSVDALRHREFLRTYSFGHNDSFWGVAAANNNTDDYNVGGLALQMMSRIADEQNVPVCVLNGALSASTIEQHFRRNESPDDPKSWYARMRWRAKTSGLWKAAKAMIWYQGESNQGGGYTEKFAQLYNAWKQDYSNLQKIYVVQIRPSDCGQTDHALLREIQRRLPSQFSDVELIASVGVPAHDGCHFGNEGYIELGNRLYGFVRRDFYQNAAQNVPAFHSPSLQRARWISADKKELALEFAPTDSLVATPDTLVGGTLRTLANDAFLFDGAPAKVSAIRIEKNIVRLSFAAPQTATRISYIPDRCYADATNVGAPCVVYQGPWLVSSSHRLAAPTFHDVAIDAVE
jgi:tetratricopeptide (TPR) repeat protein